MLELLADWGFILFAVFMAYSLGKKTVDYSRTRWVEGKPNEWVVIYKNGVKTRAGVGLATYLMPFEQAVIFPSVVHKVTFKTSQVTQEMQGVDVYAMLVWSVHRDYPEKAYQFMKKYLYHKEDKYDNTFIQMGQAILRNKIANATIDQIIKNRSLLRDAIRSEMGGVVKGWGIWLETIEITEVRVSSSSLFKNMQTQFRETNRQVATLQRREVDDAIWEEQSKYGQEQFKRQWIDSKNSQFLQFEQDLIKKEEDLKQYTKLLEIKKTQIQRKNE